MAKLLSRLIILSSLLLLGACPKPPSHQAMPSWIHEPGDGAVGSAKTHVKGRYYQEDLAISRARERLAARFGVEVSSVQTIKEKVLNERAYVTSNKQIQQQVNKATVKAKVRATWHDKAGDEIWVWVYPMAP